MTVTQTPMIEKTQMPANQPAQPASGISWWPLLGMVGLLAAIASASVVDPRPVAIRNLQETFELLPKRHKVISTPEDRKDSETWK
jgi:hypothetical protein